MAPRRVPVWVYLCVLVTALLSLASLYYRYKAENRNRAVAIAAEIDVIQSLSAAQGLTLQQGLAEMQKQGLTSVVVPEQYASELFSEGKLQLIDGKFVEGPPEVMQRLLRGVRIRFPGLVKDSFLAASASRTGVQFPDLNLVRGAAVGLDPDHSSAARSIGLMVIARCANPPSASTDTVVQTLAWAKELGAQVFLAEGSQVLGRRDSLDSFIKSLGDHDMYYASPEFAKIGGDEDVVDKIPERVIRLHSAQSEELDKMRLDDVIDRYAKAARERNQRILLLRPLSQAADKPLSDFADLVQKIKTETQHEGGTIGAPHPFEDPGVPKPLVLLIALSIIPLAAWVVSAFISRKWVLFAFTILCLALAAGCYFKPIAISLTALLAALTLPTAAFLILDGRNAKYWYLEYVLITLVSLTGGLAVAGLLNSLPYYIHAKQFMGVKFAHFFPIALVGGYFFFRFSALKKSLASPMEWGKALLALVVVGGLAFMISRTGNDNPAGVSDLELKVRAVLDAILFVRPRTKEFMIGHPFLIVGIGMLISLRKNEPRFQRWKGWVTLFLMLGAIGQTSIVNTMCHIHTPLTISLARIGVGFIAGGILGAAVWGVLRRVSESFRPAEG